MKVRILSLLALLCAVVQGAWAVDGIYCTASDRGRVVCTDGSIYGNVAAATADGKTAVAMIAFVDEENKKGLALALQDDGNNSWDSSIEICNNKNTSQPVVGATWKLATKDEWQSMIDAAGGASALRDGFNSVGGANLEHTHYWANTRENVSLGYAWTYRFGDLLEWYPTDSYKKFNTRACLTFNLLTLYEIGSQSDWNTFCAAVNNGDTFSNKYVKLTKDYINVLTAMAGTDETNSFQGVFDGNGYTMTNNQGSGSHVSEDYCAPLRYVKNACIKNLRVNGVIYTNNKYAAGIVARSYGMLYLSDCRSSVYITSYRADIDYHGGLVAENNGTVFANRCIFDGFFAAEAEHSNQTTYCGGFVGKTSESSITTIKNSLLKPNSVSAGMVNNTFVGTDDGTVTIENSYFVATDNLPTNQGTKVNATAPDNEICKQITINGTTVYTDACTVGGVEATYDLNQGAVFITPALTDPLTAAALTFGTDLTVTLDGNAAQHLPVIIHTADSHTLVLTGTGNYTGTKTINITATGDPAISGLTISSEAEWNAFAESVNDGTNNFQGQTVKLAADISVTEMVGSSETNSFQGTFLGNNKTLTFTKGSSERAFGEENCAPFRYTNNATIMELRVAGNIYTSRKFAAGLVARNAGTTDISNCTVGTVIHSSVSGDGTHGGIVGMPASGATTNITGCVYNGRLLTTNGTTYCGGFVGWSGTTTAYVSNSLYAPNTAFALSDGETAINSGATFVRAENTPTIATDCYYTEDMGTTQGSPVYTTVPNNEISKLLRLADGNEYYIPCVTISGVANAYDKSEGVSITPVLTNAGGATLSLNTDYTVKLNEGDVTEFPVTIDTKGDYTLTFTGKGSYYGSKSISFSVYGSLEGSGDSESDPIKIDSAADWITFANAVSDGNSYSGKFVRLNADISVTQIVGVWSETESERRPFSGTFDGNNHTITATITDNSNSGTALFRHINNATIKNLTVAGNINGAIHTAALVGFQKGTDNKIMNCTVTANVNGGSHIGGFVGHTLDSNISITDCVFSGLLTGGGNFKGVFVGWSDQGDRTVTDCLYLMADGQNTSNFDMIKTGGTGSLTVERCYKTTSAGSYGTQVLATASDGEIYRQITVRNITVYSKPCSVSNIMKGYVLDSNNPTSISPAVEAPYDNASLTLGTDYTAMLNDDIIVNSFPYSISSNGTYNLKFTGVGNYVGTKVVTFVVLNQGECYPVNSETIQMSETTYEYKVFDDVTITSRITISGNVTLNLAEGATLTAQKGIELSSGNSLTINGPGALTINGCDQSKSGIGAVNAGTLTINGGTINVQGGQYGAGIGGDRRNTGGGTITINGGTINAKGGQYGAGIGGGYDDSEEQYTRCGDIVFNGGKVTATGGEGASGMGPGYEKERIEDDDITYQDDVYNSGTLTLSWTDLDDFVNASSFKSSRGSKLNSITVADGKQLIIEGMETPIDKNTSNILDKANGKTISAYGQGGDYTLADGVAYTRKGDLPVNSVIYQKTLGEERIGKHQAWLVPFDYTIKAEDTEKFSFYKINMIANAPDPSTNAGDDIWVFLKKVEAGTMLHANMPYVYKPKEAVTDYVFTTENTTLKAKATDARLTMMTAEDTYTLYGTYEPTLATAQDPFYYVNISGSLSLGNNGTVTVGAFRWIMRVESKYGNSPAYVRRIIIFDGENDETTGIKNAQWSMDDGQSGIWYTLDGRTLDGKPTRAGVYIHNKKKVVIK